MSALFAAVMAVFVSAAPHPAHAYNIDPHRITVSGLSSGAYMAGQIQVALSDMFSGAGIIAGGPYYCSGGSVSRALNSCMDTSGGTLNVQDLLATAHTLEQDGSIAPLQNIQKAKIFILSGQNDNVVRRPVADAGIAFFKGLNVPDANLKTITDLPMGHAFPTVNHGNACETAGTTPFISACGYDGAGAILSHLYGPLNPPARSFEDNYFLFPQNNFSSSAATWISLDDTGVAYVPAGCQRGHRCALHVALHGCQQTIEDVQDEFYAHAGYNEWAESNDIIILYPQVVRSFPLGNPNGCWDWWGYTGAKFHTRVGPQIQFIQKLVKGISDWDVRLHTQMRTHMHTQARRP
jgi:poly(3-hydroxybutyrate) depolymerase